jgi:hypothetical protein
MVTRLACLLLVCSCAGEPCPRGAMTVSVGGLVVTEAEHPTGWGSATCADCHATDALHLQGCSPEVDLVEAQALVEAEGDASCAVCHGSNGAVEGT